MRYFEESNTAWGSVPQEVSRGIVLSLKFLSCQPWTFHSICPIQSYKRLQGVLLFTEDWRQAWARSFILGVILGHGLQWFSKKFRRYPDKCNLFLHQLWYWLCPSGTKGSRLCSLPALALPKAKRGDESQTQQKPWVEATFELSIILTLTSSTQLVSPGPLPRHSSSGPICWWEVGTWTSHSSLRIRFCWLKFMSLSLQRRLQPIFSPSSMQASQ